MNEIAQQARQGSVAAIIQVMNEQLAQSSVRTRAVFAEGVLHILCEAATAEQLEQPELVEQVKQILEAISPRNIRRVQVNSRIVREQQMLWLEEISRDPENQLLWSEAIILKQPSLWRRFNQSRERVKALQREKELRKAARKNKPHRFSFWVGLLGGLVLSVGISFGAWWLYNRHLLSSASQDVFAEAVRVATEASAAGKIATSSSEWLNLASKWQLAADLMEQVPPNAHNYAIAQDRVLKYRENSQTAQKEAKKIWQKEQ